MVTNVGKKKIITFAVNPIPKFRDLFNLLKGQFIGVHSHIVLWEHKATHN